jgi:hypothetical protein
MNRATLVWVCKIFDKAGKILSGINALAYLIALSITKNIILTLIIFSSYLIAGHSKLVCFSLALFQVSLVFLGKA